LLVLLTTWGGKAQLLPAGKAVSAGQTFSHFSVVQLMSNGGLLLQNDHGQVVDVRVAAEFMPHGQQQLLTGFWSKRPYKVSVTPGINVLVHSPAKHSCHKKFTASCPAAAASYKALYAGLSDDHIQAELGDPNRCKPFL